MHVLIFVFYIAIASADGQSPVPKNDCLPIDISQGKSPFAKNACWQRISSGHAGCEGAQWEVRDNELKLLYAAHHEHLAYRWDANGRRIEVLADHYQGKRLNRPNDCVIHTDGTVWFTDPDYLFKQRPDETKELDGQFIFRYDPLDGSLSKVTSQLNKPNGIALLPDGKSLFGTDSATNDLYKSPVGSKGQLGQQEVFANLPGKGNDGIAFDPTDRLWCCAKEGIVILNELGESVAFIVHTLPQPISILFV